MTWRSRLRRKDGENIVIWTYGCPDFERESMGTQKQDASRPIRVRRIEAWALRAPVETPVETSFGIMRDRPAVFMRVEDDAGGVGIGEIWCNFPGCGAE